MSLHEFAGRFPAVIDAVRNIKKHDRIAHSYIILGDQREELTRFAWAFTQTCICANATPAGDPCEQCPNCRQIQKQQYPYLQILQPRSKLQQILINDINALDEFLHRPSAGQWRIAHIIDADRMNVQAQNAFLKTLEEPLDHTIIILISTKPSMLLNTIRSRCQILALRDNRWKVDNLPEEELVRIFHALRPLAGGFAALEASTRICRLIEQFKAESEEVAAAWLQEHMPPEDLAEKSIVDELKATANGYGAAFYRGRVRTLFEAIFTWLAQEYLRASGVNTELLPHPELLELYQRYHQALPALPPAKTFQRALDLTTKTIRESEFNVDIQLLVDNYCLQLCQRT